MKLTGDVAGDADTGGGSTSIGFRSGDLRGGFGTDTVLEGKV